MNFLEKKAFERQQEFMRHVRPKFKKRLKDRKLISVEEWQAIRANNYEWKLLHQKLDNRAFLFVLRHYLNNSSQPQGLPQFELAGSYDEAIEREFLPDLIVRFEKLLNRSAVKNRTKLRETKNKK